MAISFNAIGRTDVSFADAGTAQAGKVCKVTANGTVGACAEADNFCGVVREVRAGVAAVTMAGYVELPYSGAAPAVGYQTLAADGAGGVKLATGGRNLLVVQTDSAAKTVGVFL